MSNSEDAIIELVEDIAVAMMAESRAKRRISEIWRSGTCDGRPEVCLFEHLVAAIEKRIRSELGHSIFENYEPERSITKRSWYRETFRETALAAFIGSLTLELRYDPSYVDQHIMKPTPIMSSLVRHFIEHHAIIGTSNRLFDKHDLNKWPKLEPEVIAILEEGDSMEIEGIINKSYQLRTDGLIVQYE